jgi:hypothetical protein
MTCRLLPLLHIYSPASVYSTIQHRRVIRVLTHLEAGEQRELQDELHLMQRELGRVLGIRVLPHTGITAYSQIMISTYTIAPPETEASEWSTVR